MHRSMNDAWRFLRRQPCLLLMASYAVSLQTPPVPLSLTNQSSGTGFRISADSLLFERQFYGLRKFCMAIRHGHRHHAIANISVELSNLNLPACDFLQTVAASRVSHLQLKVAPSSHAVSLARDVPDVNSILTCRMQAISHNPVYQMDDPDDRQRCADCAGSSAEPHPYGAALLPFPAPGLAPNLHRPLLQARVHPTRHRRTPDDQSEVVPRIYSRLARIATSLPAEYCSRLSICAGPFLQF